MKMALAGIGNLAHSRIHRMDERARRAAAVEGDGMTRKIVLFGYPVSHSISPAFQQAALDRCSIGASYSASAVSPERLEYEIGRLRGEEYLGANVTIPHKEEVCSLLDGIDPWAETLGAVNTIVKDDGRLIGHNTDAYGFLRSLRERAEFEPEGASVLLLGAGGAARAAAFALSRERVASLTIANRTLARAEILAGEMRASIPMVDAIPLERAALAGAVSGADLVVNSTSIGMSRGEAEGRTPLNSGLMRPGVLVYDMVYTPLETPLVRAAREAGARAMGGLWMLIYQGAASFELWTGEKAPVEVMYEAGAKALSGEG